MKIKLETVRDVSILIASGPIEPSNFAILRAGVKKLLSDGKNKIVLELPDSSKLSTPILRELAHLNLLANELAGQVMLAKISPLTRAKIEAFSKPPVVRCFADREEALATFHPQGELPSESSGKAARSELSPSELAASAQQEAADAPKSVERSAADNDLIRELRAELRAKELTENADLRKRASALENENRILKQQLAKLVVSRKDPPEIEAWKEKVLKLEVELKDAIALAQAQTGKGPGAQAAAAALKKG